MTQEDIIKMAREAGWDAHHAEFDTRIQHFAALVAAAELLRLHAETKTLRAALDAAVAWAAPMADAPKSSRPAWFDQARAALSHKGPIL